MKIQVLASFVFAAVILPLPAGAQPLVSAANNTLGQSEKRSIIEKAGDLIVANYIDPELAFAARSRLAAALRNGEYDAINASEMLAKKVTSDLQAVTGDKHLSVIPPPMPRSSSNSTVSPAPAAQRAYAGYTRVDLLKGNIGYIKLNSFPDPAGPFGTTSAQAINDLAGTDALIIDLRDNRGGNFAGVVHLCSYFFDPRTPIHIDGEVVRKAGTRELEERQFYTHPVIASYLAKPVYLLTSRRTFSAGEKFVYAMQAQKRARVIGETTEGSANGTSGHELPFRFAIGIPSQRTVNPVTKTNFEGVGVKPDVPTARDQAFQSALREILASDPAKYAALRTNELRSEDDLTQARLLKYRDQPQPGGAAAVRALFDGIASGKPDYAMMSDEVAQMIRADFDFFHADMKRLGEARSVTFTGVAPSGLDNYEVRTAIFTERFSIYLGPDGKIAAASFYAPVPIGP